MFQYNSTTGTWGIAFDYPALAGSHMDGMEVLVQPGTNVAYVYVADMTSDFIDQYHIDPEQGWVQDNLFEYQDDTGVVVEDMGFGAFHHFWAAGGGELYEVGGGDITAFVEPPPPRIVGLHA